MRTVQRDERRRAGRWWPGRAVVLAGAVTVAAVLALAVAVAVAVAVPGMPRAVAAEPAWTWPLAEPVSVVRPFDPPEHRYAAGHRGADLAGAAGAPVLAAGAGRIGYAGLLAGRGVVVVVHGDLRTTYEPVDADVRVGQQVAVGEPLGRLAAGHQGCPAAACLHWGLRRGDTYLDPVQLVDAGPVRLLPVSPAAAGAPEGAGGPAGAGRPRERLTAPRDGRPDAAAPEETVAEPHWSLRAAEAPLGGAAVAALAAGLVLLTRPRRPPDGPATPGALLGPADDTAAPGSPGVVPVDLGAERLRRRAG